MTGTLEAQNVANSPTNAYPVGHFKTAQGFELQAVVSVDSSGAEYDASNPLPVDISGVIPGTKLEVMGTLGYLDPATDPPVLVGAYAIDDPNLESTGGNGVISQIRCDQYGRVWITSDTTLTTQDNSVKIDNTAFVDGSSLVIPSGYIFDDVAGTALTENDVAAARIDSKRAQVQVIEDATVRGRRAVVTAGGLLRVDASATTISIGQPVGVTASAGSFIAAVQGYDAEGQSFGFYQNYPAIHGGPAYTSVYSVGPFVFNDGDLVSSRYSIYGEQFVTADPSNPLLVAIASGAVTASVSGTVAISGHIPGTSAAQLGKAEDQAHVTGDVGVMALGVRQAAPANLSGNNGDYEPFQISNGRVWASATIDAALPAGANNIGSVNALQTNKSKYGTSNQGITCTLASLANNAARASTYVDNATNLFIDALVMVKIRSAAASTSATGTVNVYAYGTADGGTTYSDGATGSDAGITLTNPPNVRLIGVINVVANSTTYNGGPFSVSAAFNGILPERWGIIIENKSGAALDSTEGNHAKFYQGIQRQGTA